MDKAGVKAAAGKVVSIHYTLTGTDGKVLDRSGDEPLAYLHGTESMVPGLERQLEGKVVGDKFRAVVPPEDGYGERHKNAERELPRDAFPKDAALRPGMQFAAHEPDGGMIPIRVVKVETDSVTVDLNHPLAGETLTFDVEVVEVRDATDEERSHGHVHGPGGVHD